MRSSRLRSESSDGFVLLTRDQELFSPDFSTKAKRPNCQPSTAPSAVVHAQPNTRKQNLQLVLHFDGAPIHKRGRGPLGVRLGSMAPVTNGLPAQSMDHACCMVTTTVSVIFRATSFPAGLRMARYRTIRIPHSVHGNVRRPVPCE
jgi:hypothetical protein